MADRVGQQLGNYTIIKLLGQGGFADVYLGEHLYLKSQAAIKLLQTRLSSQADLDSFLKEAQTIARLAHPNIVRVLDFGSDGDAPYLVMDYAPNGTLRQRHPRGTPVPLAQVISYVKQIADALQYAHDEHLIHRDIKPENMLLGRRNEVLLSDFGIALVAQNSLSQHTQEAVGTVAYMSPEQIQGKPRPASDQYALGVVTYEWLTGDCPFKGTITEMCTQHMFAIPALLTEKLAELPVSIERVVMQTLNKDPKQRFESVAAFASALELASQSTGAQTELMAPSMKLPNSFSTILMPDQIPAPPSYSTKLMGDEIDKQANSAHLANSAKLSPGEHNQPMGSVTAPTQRQQEPQVANTPPLNSPAPTFHSVNTYAQSAPLTPQQGQPQAPQQQSPANPRQPQVVLPAPPTGQVAPIQNRPYPPAAAQTQFAPSQPANPGYGQPAQPGYGQSAQQPNPGRPYQQPQQPGYGQSAQQPYAGGPQTPYQQPPFQQHPYAQAQAPQQPPPPQQQRLAQQPQQSYPPPARREPDYEREDRYEPTPAAPREPRREASSAPRESASEWWGLSGTWTRQIIATLVGLVLVCVLHNFEPTLLHRGVPMVLVIPLFFGGAFGPWSGLIVGLGGALISNFFFPGNDVIQGMLAGQAHASIHWWFTPLIFAIAGFATGLPMLFKLRRYPSIGTTIRSGILAVIGMAAGLGFLLYRVQNFRLFPTAGLVILLAIGVSIALLFVYSIIGRLIDAP